MRSNASITHSPAPDTVPPLSRLSSTDDANATDPMTGKPDTRAGSPTPERAAGPTSGAGRPISCGSGDSPGTRGVVPAVDGAQPCADVAVRASARFTAETTARSEAVVIEVAMPTPQVTVSPMATSTYDAAWASSPADMACSE